MPALRTARILVNPNTQDFTVWPSRLRLAPGDLITWEIHWDLGTWATKEAKGTFLVDFEDPGAMERHLVRGQSGAAPKLEYLQKRGPDFRAENGVARSTGMRGNFHYKVAVCIDGVLYADMTCPSGDVR